MELGTVAVASAESAPPWKERLQSKAPVVFRTPSTHFPHASVPKPRQYRDHGGVPWASAIILHCNDS
jgi:hypothetical protein